MNRTAYKTGSAAALATFKLAEWNWELTGRKIKKDAISSDNGRRAYGTRFSASEGRPSREVSQAFNSMDSTKPSDFLNAGNEALIGAST
jgi:hypothetical protein